MCGQLVADDDRPTRANSNNNAPWHQAQFNLQNFPHDLFAPHQGLQQFEQQIRQTLQQWNDDGDSSDDDMYDDVQSVSSIDTNDTSNLPGDSQPSVVVDVATSDEDDDW